MLFLTYCKNYPVWLSKSVKQLKSKQISQMVDQSINVCEVGLHCVNIKQVSNLKTLPELSL